MLKGGGKTVAWMEEKAVALSWETGTLCVPVTCKVRFREELPEEHPVCHVAEDSSL